METESGEMKRDWMTHQIQKEIDYHAVIYNLIT